MQRIKILFIILPLILIFNSFQDDMKKSTVLICYGKIKPEFTKDFKYVIVESKHYNAKNIKALKANNEKVFAYISLGEVNENATHFEDLKKLTLGKNDIWNSYYLDLESKKTIEKLMLIVDETFAQGYDGLFLDNIDNFTIHGPQKDQKEAVVKLIQKIKEKYPKKMYIQNAGLDLADDTSRYIDVIAIESIATNYSFKDKKYNLRENNDYKNYMSRIDSINAKYSIPFILVEYADSKTLVSQIEKRFENVPYEYFVGKIDLQTIPQFN
jgi:hypothetical protein